MSLIPLLISDVLALFSGVQPAQWGIYLGGFRVVAADNVVTFGYRQDWALADFPIEKGAFASYNKVQIPFTPRFRFSAGGSEANRRAMLTSIATVSGTLLTYNIVTPEAVYLNVNINHYDYDRKHDSGAGLITVDVWTQEIRQVGFAAMANTMDAANAAPVNGGTVQSVLFGSSGLPAGPF